MLDVINLKKKNIFKSVHYKYENPVHETIQFYACFARQSHDAIIRIYIEQLLQTKYSISNLAKLI